MRLFCACAAASSKPSASEPEGSGKGTADAAARAPRLEPLRLEAGRGDRRAQAQGEAVRAPPQRLDRAQLRRLDELDRAVELREAVLRRARRPVADWLGRVAAPAQVEQIRHRERLCRARRERHHRREIVGAELVGGRGSGADGGRAGLRREPVHDRLPGLDLELPGGELVEPGVEAFLLDELLRAHPIEPGAEVADAVLIGVLDGGLAGEEPGRERVAREEAPCRARRPDGKQRGADCSRDQPAAPDGNVLRTRCRPVTRSEGSAGGGLGHVAHPQKATR